MNKYCSVSALCFTILCFTIVFYACGSNEQSFACTDVMDRMSLGNANESVNITLQKDEFLCNGELGNEEQIEHLTYLLSNISVAYPLPKLDKERFPESRFKTEGIQIKLYRGTQCLKNYSLLMDSTHCYALMEGAQQVYIVHVPGNNLKNAIKAEAKLWIHPLLFSYQVADIEQIQLTDKLHPQQSWTIKHLSGNYQLSANGVHADSSLSFYSARMQRYLTYFNQVEFDALLNTIDTTISLYSLTVSTRANTETYCVYGILTDQVNDYGVPLVYDRDRFYLQVQSTNKRYLMKWINFDILLHNWKGE